MARPKEFDPDTALDRAMELFWRNGYEATSLADLTENLGIGRASLYATFGDKHELFMKALRHYFESGGLVEMLSQPGPALPGVRALVDVFAHSSIHDEQRKGCLGVNSATELMARDPAVARVVESVWDSLEVALTSALTRARAQGEIPPDKNPPALSRFLLVFLLGVRVMGRGSPNPERIRDAVAEALAAVEE